MSNRSTKLLPESLEAMRKFSQTYAQRTGTFFCSDLSVTAVVIEGLAKHKDEYGSPLCPCRHYEDKSKEAGVSLAMKSHAKQAFPHMNVGIPAHLCPSLMPTLFFWGNIIYIFSNTLFEEHLFSSRLSACPTRRLSQVDTIQRLDQH